MTDPRAIATAFVAEIDPAELTVRLLEIGCKIRRPPGMSGRQALAQIEDSVAQGTLQADIFEDFKCMALAAVEYLREQIDRGKRTV